MDSKISFDNTEKVLETIGKFFVKRYKEKLNNSKPYKTYATGKLYNSVNYSVTFKDGNVRLSFTMPDEYQNKQTKEWFIEVGRKPGSKPPPIEVIRRWITIKNILPKKGQTKDSLPYMIQRGIVKNGIKAKPYIQLIKRELKDFLPDLEKAIKKDFETEIELELKKIKTPEVKTKGNFTGNIIIKTKK